MLSLEDRKSHQEQRKMKIVYTLCFLNKSRCCSLSLPFGPRLLMEGLVSKPICKMLWSSLSQTAYKDTMKMIISFSYCFFFPKKETIQSGTLCYLRHGMKRGGSTWDTWERSLRIPWEWMRGVQSWSNSKSGCTAASWMKNLQAKINMGSRVFPSCLTNSS